ncbi:MAG: electron transfer flavoprotein subunit beta [Gammaproteobacteria bacterium]|jgi:electron transfer flavoprotein beta subunit|nr:electron transfer flavoprotein subunit beta [Gammaproteobacteria bacterium]
MKVLVALKRVVDPYVKIRVRDDGSGVETANVKMSTNPFDEIAIEEAVRLKEQGSATSTTVVAIGSEASQENLRAALALGIDNAVFVPNDAMLQPLAVARILQQIVVREAAQLVILGKQAIDDDNNQVGQMLAALLSWPQCTFASAVKIAEGGASLEVTREIDGGLEVLSATLPAVITTDLRLNTPRYASLPNIMRAKQKPLTTLTLEELAVDTQTAFEVLSVAAPKTRKAGVMVDSVDALLDKLKNEAKVIA